MISSASNVPVERQVTNIAHGHGGIYAASRMICIRGNEKNAGWRKLAFSPGIFSFSLCP